MTKRSRIRKSYRQGTISNTSITSVIHILFALSILNCIPPALSSTSTTYSSSLTETNPKHQLDENSVVLITGAAGFLGYHLTLALHHTYSVSKIIAIDTLGADDLDLTSLHQMGHSSRTKNKTPPMEFTPPDDQNRAKTVREEERKLTAFEFKRQRLFHAIQTLGPNKIDFYKVDIRDAMPEDYRLENYSKLNYIFQKHRTDGITHVVHLADFNPDGRAVPRNVQENRMGLFDVVLEQLWKGKREDGVVPHLTYASSYEVYPSHEDDDDRYAKEVLLDERQPIGTPTTPRGAAKLLEEMLASTYADVHGIWSVGLRFFEVYGCWGTPGTAIHDMAERAVSSSRGVGASFIRSAEVDFMVERDYVYIDDAIDAMMAAMQFRPTVPRLEDRGDSERLFSKALVVNVGTGRGSSLGDIAEIMEGYFPQSTEDASRSIYDKMERSQSHNTAPPKSFTSVVASNERAKALLGFEFQTSLNEGIVQLLSWYHDRASPYDIDDSIPNEAKSPIVQAGLESCSAHDAECLRGFTVFPCASTCSHPKTCTESYYDPIVDVSRTITASCTSVMYTVDLDDNLKDIYSATVDPSPGTHSFLLEKYCNVAFVSENSSLVRRLKKRHGISDSRTVAEVLNMGITTNALDDSIVMHGPWVLLPVVVPRLDTDDEHINQLLPKMSPEIFFSPNTIYAIYCDSNIVFSNVAALLHTIEMQYVRDVEESATAMMFGYKDGTDHFSLGGRGTGSKSRLLSSQGTLQDRTYTAIRIALQGLLGGEGSEPIMDYSWIVHSLSLDDARQLRCDIYSEVIKWGVSDNGDRAMDLMLRLHGFWSSAIAYWNFSTTWWHFVEEETLTAIPQLQTQVYSVDAITASLTKCHRMGVLSSTKTQSFVRVVSSRYIGVLHAQIK